MSKRQSYYSPRFTPESPPVTRCCDAPECGAAGEYRAPKSRTSLNEYYWFCLDHVREYNKSWDFYAGMTPEQIERQVRFDTIWQRPTWPLGNWRIREKILKEEARRQYGDGGPYRQERHRSDPGGDGEQRRSHRAAEDEALAVLDLDQPVTFEEIKARYRELAKRHHPDANGGDKAAEERLKQINQAYNTLKAGYGK